MSAKTDCEKLMNEALPFAEQMLREHGEFHPYGRVMKSNGEIVWIAGYDGGEHPPSLDTIRLIKSVFVRAARDGTYKATALVYDVRVALPGDGLKSDAIAVSLNHQDAYSVTVLFPYILNGSDVAFGEVMAQAGDADIFPV